MNFKHKNANDISEEEMAIVARAIAGKVKSGRIKEEEMDAELKKLKYPPAVRSIIIYMAYDNL